MPEPLAASDNQPEEPATQSYTARPTVHAPELTATSYGASTPEEVAQLQRQRRIDAAREAIATGESFSVVDVASGEMLASQAGFVWPVVDAALTDTFGTRDGAHAGIDLAAAEGAPVLAASPGVVVLSEESHEGYGVAVMIEHANGVRTLYGHLVSGSRLVGEGDWVEAGQQIAAVGNTGRSFGPHLHFEVIADGEPADPLLWLP